MTPMSHYPHLLGGIRALNWLVLLKCERVEAKAVLVTRRVAHTVKPDRVTTTQRTRARLEPNIVTSLVAENQAPLLINSKSLPLAIPNRLLRTSRVLNDSLAHSAPVDEELLGRVGGVEVQSAVAELELGVVWGLRAAGRVLGGRVNAQAVVGGLELRVLEVGAGADVQDAEDVAVSDLRGLNGAGGGNGCGGDEGGGNGELHGDGWLLGIKVVDLCVDWLLRCEDD
jgi:hypothetical protein